MTEIISKIPARIKNAAVGGHVCGAEDIIDDDKNKTQQQINSEVEESLGTGGSVDERIVAAKTEIIGDAASDYNTLGKLEDKVQAEATRAEEAEEQLRTLYNNLQQSQPIPVTSLPATGEAGKIYRLAGTTSYADYMYAEGALTTPIKMAEYNNAIDNEPTAGSDNLVKSGGVEKSIRKQAKCLDDDTDADFNIGDEEGNVIVQFKYGHLKTKHFDSLKNISGIESRLAKSTYDNSDADFNIGDEEGNVIVQFKNGHIKTKNFDSSNNSSDLYGINVLIVGDSITVGQGLPSYNDRWGQKLADKYNWNVVINASSGIPLATDTNGRDAIVSRLAYSLKNASVIPDLIIIWGGHNDTGETQESPLGTFEDGAEITDEYITTKADKTTFRGALRYCAEVCHKYAPNAKVFCLTLEHIYNYNPFANSPNYNIPIYEFNTAIENASFLYGLECINMGACGINEVNAIRDNLTSDGVHPNIQGTKQIVAYLSKQLETRYIKYIN